MFLFLIPLTYFTYLAEGFLVKYTSQLCKERNANILWNMELFTASNTITLQKITFTVTYNRS